MGIQTFFEGDFFHRNGSGTDHLNGALGPHKDRRLPIAFDHAILKNDLFEITRNQQRNFLPSRLTGDPYIFEMAGDFFVGIAPDHAGLAQTGYRAIFIGDLPQRAVTAPSVQAVKFHADQLIALGKAAIAKDHILCRAAGICPMVTIIAEGGLYRMTAGFVCHPAVLLSLRRELFPMTVGRIDANTVFDHHIVAAKPDGDTAGVEYAVAYHHIIVVKACNAVITYIKIAVFDHRIVAGPQVNTVVSAQNRNIADGDVLALKNGVAPVGTVDKGVSLQVNIAALPKAHPVGTAITLFSHGVVAVHTVKEQFLITMLWQPDISTRPFFCAKSPRIRTSSKTTLFAFFILKMLDGSRTYTQTESADSRVDGTVGDGDIFTVDILVFDPGFHAANGNAIIAAVNDAVGYGHIPAAIQIQTVRVLQIQGVEGFIPPNRHILATVEEGRPAAGVPHGDIVQADMLTFYKYDELAGTQLFRVLAFIRAGTPPEPLVIFKIVVYESVAVAIHRAKAGNGHIFCLMSNDQMLTHPIFRGNAEVLLVGSFFIVIVHVVRGQQGSAHGKMELYIGSNSEPKTAK